MNIFAGQLFKQLSNRVIFSTFGTDVLAGSRTRTRHKANIQ